MNINCKTCSECERVLGISNFNIRKNLSRYNQCKSCTNARAKKYRLANKELIKQKQRKWYAENGKELKKEYDKMNREKTRKYEKMKYKTDTNYRLRKVFRTRLNKTFKKVRKNAGIFNYVGLEYNLFIAWIEFQFDKNMTWENYGSYWDIDHVWPCNKFDLTIESDIYSCFNWKNLQPLKKSENYSKCDRINNDMCINQISKILKFKSLYASTNSLEKFSDGSEKRTEIWLQSGEITGLTLIQVLKPSSQAMDAVQRL